MNIKTSLLATAMVLLVFLYSCTNETVDNLTTDCSASDLAVELSSSTLASCSQGGSITVTGSGGKGNIVYSINGNDFGTSTSFSDLSAGSYTITARDENGCTSATTVTVEAEANTISFEVEVAGSSCGTETGSITITATGGSGNTEYSVDGTNFFGNPAFTQLAPGEYNVTVRDGGCIVNRTVSVLSDASLSGDIMPIINTNCAITGCHRDAVSPRFTSNESIVNAANRIRARTTARTMPPSGRPDLSNEEIAKIVCWVEDGAPNN